MPPRHTPSAKTANIRIQGKPHALQIEIETIKSHSLMRLVVQCGQSTYLRPSARPSAWMEPRRRQHASRCARAPSAVARKKGKVKKSKEDKTLGKIYKKIENRSPEKIQKNTKIKALKKYLKSSIKLETLTPGAGYFYEHRTSPTRIYWLPPACFACLPVNLTSQSSPAVSNRPRPAAGNRPGTSNNRQTDNPTEKR